MNEKCQIFTPSDYVEKLLDSVGYLNNLFGKKILENSCGDGKILVAIVSRYIDDCKRQGLSRTQIKNGLARDIYGVEIDKKHFEKCIINLNKILNDRDIMPVQWNIVNEDYLRKNNNTRYQYIIGNPPYITYKEMDEAEQIFLKENFSSCKKGKFDYCYAFIEKSIESLADDGKMAYLIPSSIFKTVFGANLRFVMKKYIVSILDFTQEKMFDDALVKSAIMVLTTNRNGNLLSYTDVGLNKNLQLNINSLGEKWYFTDIVGHRERRFGDYYKVAHVVATLKNEAFVLKRANYKEIDTHLVLDNYYLEKEVIKETATPRSLRYGKVEKIIFPYRYDNNKLIKYTNEEFETQYPGVVSYLNKFRKDLDKRKSDDNASWFEYGRSQALMGIYNEKLLMSTVVTTEVSVYLLDRECIPYSGMYIIVKENNNDYNLEDALNILRGRDFIQYVLDVGIHISGSSLRITSKDIEEFRF